MTKGSKEHLVLIECKRLMESGYDHDQRKAMIRTVDDILENHLGHNGWANYETWCVNLWLGNDEGTDLMIRQAIRVFRKDAPQHRCVMEGIWSQDEAVKFQLADMLKAFIEENTPEATGVYADLTSAAIAEVDWHAIADGFLEQ